MENKQTMVPYIVHEGTIDRLERIIRRLWILCLVIFIAFVVSNGVWIWYESQYVDNTTITQEVDSGSVGDTIVNGINYGKDKTDSN